MPESLPESYKKTEVRSAPTGWELAADNQNDGRDFGEPPIIERTTGSPLEILSDTSTAWGLAVQNRRRELEESVN